MSDVRLYDCRPAFIDADMAAVASRAPDSTNAPDPYGFPNDRSIGVRYGSLLLDGYGFTYDTSGRLSGGTIYFIEDRPPQPAGFGPTGTLEQAGSVSIPVVALLNKITTHQSVVPLLFDADNTISVATNDAYSTS